MKLPFLLFSSFLFLLGLGSCQDDHLEVYEEPITSMLYILTPDSGETVVLSYLDRDGDGGMPALINSGKLRPNTKYQGEIRFNGMNMARLAHFTDSTSVAQEPELHQLFFLPQNGLKMETSYADYDSNGDPVGLKTTLVTAVACSGQLKILLIHAPNKSGSQVSQGDVSDAGGKIELELEFNVEVSGN